MVRNNKFSGLVRLSLLFSLIVLQSACGGGSSSEPEAPPPQSAPPPPPTFIDSPVSFNAVLEQPSRDPDVTISYGQEPTQFGELWLPQNTGQSAVPLIVVVHGGCWSSSFGLDYTYGMATALADTGYAVWSLEFRRFGDPGGGWPTTLEDLELAIEQRTLLAGFVNLTDDVIVTGHSSGGHLGSLLSASKATVVTGFIGLASINDIVGYANLGGGCPNGLVQFMGGTPNQVPTAYFEADPVNQVLNPNSIYLHGDFDDIVPATQAEVLGLEFEIIEGAGHFDLVHAETRAFTRLLSTIEILLNN